MSIDKVRWKMARQIALKYEARYKNGNIAVYELPEVDGGGAYEVAGINEFYNKTEADHLVNLINNGQFIEAENYATAFIAKKTDSAVKYTDLDGVEFFIRDCIFNRGATGATLIVQISLGVTADGIFGPISSAALRSAELNIDQLFLNFRAGREQYEREFKGRDENHQFWDGLVNRWNNAVVFAKSL